jgi:hypothetical protein
MLHREQKNKPFARLSGNGGHTQKVYGDNATANLRLSQAVVREYSLWAWHPFPKDIFRPSPGLLIPHHRNKPIVTLKEDFDVCFTDHGFAVRPGKTENH